MILNIFGPSGSGKTTFIRKVLQCDKTHLLFKYLNNENSLKDINPKVSISLIPLPLFRGTVNEFFDIFSINIASLLTLEKELRDLSDSIFDQIVNDKNLESISLRRVDTFSAGEMRRLYLLKSLIVDSNIMIIDEPFSNSDEKLWEIIYQAIASNSMSIVLSHLPLDKFFDSSKDNKSINIYKVKKDFLQELD